MRVRSICAVFLGLALVCNIGFASAHEYQTGKIIKVERQESHASSGGTDAATKEAVTSYHISIQLGDKIYVCRYQTSPDNDISWVEGKDVQARVSGKAVFVKRSNGKEARGSILRTASAGNP